LSTEDGSLALVIGLSIFIVVFFVALVVAARYRRKERKTSVVLQEMSERRASISEVQAQLCK
jgi:heme/copper-type cytochrome/quinol oxidase subunit 2